LPRRKTSAPSRVTGWFGLISDCVEGPPGCSVVVTSAVKLRGAPNWAPPTWSSKVAFIDLRSMVNGGSFSGSVMAPGRNES
jgi:hypothetical protein